MNVRTATVSPIDSARVRPALLGEVLIIGVGNTASGLRATAFGHFNLASGVQSSAFGSNSRATGNGSSVFGLAGASTGTGSLALSGWFDTDGDGLEDKSELF